MPSTTHDQSQNDTSESSPRQSLMIPSSSVTFSPHLDRHSPTNDENSSSFAQHLDIESLLQQDERNRASSPDNDNDDNNTAISSLPPFGDGLRRASFDFSSIGSSLGNLMDSHISIDDDSECGPVPSYPAAVLAELSTPSKTIADDEIKDPSGKASSRVKLTPGSNGRPKEVYINATKDHDKDDPKNIPTPGKLSAFMGMSRRHKASDASVGGSSIGSNSLSSIFESIGYFKRKRGPHPSRGLTKRRERGSLYRFVTGSPEPRPASFDNEREEFLFRQREARMVNLRAFILMLFLVCILISVIELSSINEAKHVPASKKGIVELKGSKRGNLYYNDEIDERDQHHPAHNSISLYLVKDGVPKDDGRPSFVNNHGSLDQVDDGSIRNEGDNGTNDSVLLVDSVKSDSVSFASINTNLLDANKVPTSTNNPQYHHTPLLWNIPESGNDMISEMYSVCKSFKMASGLDKTQHRNHLRSPKLQVFNLDKKEVVNVDLTSSSGIQRAKKMNLVHSNMADIIISPLFEEAVTLFDESHKGLAFTVMTDPIDRLLNLFRTLNQGEDSSNVSGMSLQSFASGRYVVGNNNWMVRHLTGKFHEELTSSDLDLAKKILNRKFIVGLSDELDDSIKRFEIYFGGESSTTEEKGRPHEEEAKCSRSILKEWQDRKKESSEFNKSEKKKKKSSSVIRLLENQNKFDMELYTFAKQLYTMQGKTIFQAYAKHL